MDVTDVSFPVQVNAEIVGHYVFFLGAHLLFWIGIKCPLSLFSPLCSVVLKRDKCVVVVVEFLQYFDIIS